AGMGGELIKEIIIESINTVKGMRFLILQPAQNPEVLRKFVYSGNFTILSENLVRETDGRFYEYIKVRYNPEVMGFSKNPFDFEISPVLIRHRDPLLNDFITNKIKEIELIKAKLDLSYDSSKSKLEELEKKEDKLSEVLKWL
ncbi:MAG: tRNA (adenine(22)-N(1))-methyltransferase TrmK, partial [Clostridiaceae bacterium]